MALYEETCPAAPLAPNLDAHREGSCESAFVFCWFLFFSPVGRLATSNGRKKKRVLDVHRETMGLEGGVFSLGVEGRNYGVGGEI